MFELPTQPLSILFAIANVRDIILILQDDDDPDWQINKMKNKATEVFSLSFDIEEHDLGNLLAIAHLHQACGDITVHTTRDPWPENRSRADTFIANTSLSNLRHLAGAIGPPLLKHPGSTINISRESDVIPTQALPHPITGGDQSLPQPKASGDYNIPEHQQGTFVVAKQFRQAFEFKQTPWGLIYNEEYSMVDEAWKLVIQTQDHQKPFAGAPVGTPSGCQLRGGPPVQIDLQTREAVNNYSVFGFLIELMMIQNLKCLQNSKLKISTIQGSWADGVRRTIVHSYQLDSWWETEFQIQVRELLFDDTYLSKVNNGEIWWFT